MRFTTVAVAASAMFVALVEPRQLAAQAVDGTGTTYALPRWIGCTPTRMRRLRQMRQCCAT